MKLICILLVPRATIDCEILKGHLTALKNDFDGFKFKKLLPQKNFSMTRLLGKKFISKIPCMLTTHNYFASSQAFDRLAWYKSILSKRLEISLGSFSGQNILRFDVLTQIQFKSIFISLLKAMKNKSNGQIWKYKFELLPANNRRFLEFYYLN